MKDFIRASCEADPTIEIDKIFANAADTNFKPPSMPESVVNNKQQFLLDKWWGTGKGECDLKDDYVMIFLWDNEGNEFWIVSNKFSEELTSKTKQLINSKWLIYGYGKPDIGDNYVKGVYYILGKKEGLELEYFGISYKFKNRKNKNAIVIDTLEHSKLDESGNEIKQDVLLNVINIIESNGAECAFPTSTLHISTSLDDSNTK